MDRVDMDERHNSLMDLSQPPLSSLGMSGGLSMIHSISVRKVYGKDIVCLHNDLYMHPLTIHV